MKGFASIGAMLLLASCRDTQSVLAPHGPRAAEILQLAWVLFAGGALILLVVVVAALSAMGAPARVRRWLASERAVIAGGIAFPAVVLAGLLVYGVLLTRSGAGVPAREALAIEVSGEQWWWRVTYRSQDGQRIATANEIRVPVGREVAFTLKSADVIHSFWVPSLGGKVDMIPGRETQLRVTADRAGVFRGQCAEYCGGPHALMALQVLAMPEADYQAWLSREAAPAAVPSSEEEKRGQGLFLAAGCGACHAVRGTQASGTVGPDLTHVGSRRAIGADTLRLTQDNLIRFISAGQHVKPGNLMPEFRIFAEDERRALAAYLLALR